GLQLARALQRSREMAIRAALGAHRIRLGRQLLVENLTLAFLGGVLGIGVAIVILRVLEADSLTPFTRFDIELNAVALGVAALLMLGTGTLAGLVPAMRGSAIQPAGGLREDTRAGSEGRGSSRFRSGLVVAQMAMAVTLLVGASLLLRTAAAINGIEQGYDAENVLTGETRLTADVYQDEANRRIYLEQVVDRLAEIPGVRGSTLIKGMPFAGDNDDTLVRAEGSDLDWEQLPWVYAPPVAQGYFEFMGIPVVAGRTSQRTDGPEGERVMVVSRNLAERLYPGTSAVGRMAETRVGPFRIVGIVENTREHISTEFRENAYFHYLQAPPSFFSVLIRTEGAPEPFERALLEAFWSVDSNQPLWEVMSLERRMTNVLRNELFFSVIFGGFAGLALLLAAVGLYGVMAYSVARRRHELGVRMALGAERGRILQMVLRQGVGMTALGALVGIGAASALAQLMASLLFGVTPFDVLSFTVAPAVLVLVAVVATYIPARRATRVDPLETLRS
ncbi:MAG: FtsX-like permease family protein, partial [Longimicrobiales bacterium]